MSGSNSSPQACAPAGAYVPVVVKIADLEVNDARTDYSKSFDNRKDGVMTLSAAHVALRSGEAEVEESKVLRVRSEAIVLAAQTEAQGAEKRALAAANVRLLAEQAHTETEGMAKDKNGKEQVLREIYANTASLKKAAEEPEKLAKDLLIAMKEEERKATHEQGTAEEAKRRALFTQIHCRAVSTESEATSLQAKVEAKARAAAGNQLGEDPAEMSHATSQDIKRNSEAADKEAKQKEIEFQKAQAALEEATHKRKDAEESHREKAEELSKWTKQELRDFQSWDSAKDEAQQATSAAEKAKAARDRALDKSKKADEQFNMKRELAEAAQKKHDDEANLVAGRHTTVVGVLIPRVEGARQNLEECESGFLLAGRRMTKAYEEAVACRDRWMYQRGEEQRTRENFLEVAHKRARYS